MTTQLNKDIIEMYKKLLYPMGYTLTRIEQPVLPDWEPAKEEIAKYKGMLVAELEKELGLIKSYEELLTKNAEEMKLKTINYFADRVPNEFSRRLYTGAMVGSKYQFNSKAVNVVDPLIQELTKKKNYLLKLIAQKEQQKVISDLKEIGLNIKRIGLDQVGSPRLVIELKDLK